LVQGLESPGRDAGTNGLPAVAEGLVLDKLAFMRQWRQDPDTMQ
jgi:hypothetical protein